MAKIIVLTSIILTFILINLGGYVHNSGASLACPDWPLCYGQVMPEMKGGILIEHSHRLLASLVGFLNILLVVFVAREKKYSVKLKRISYLSLFFVITQGILGGLTVIYKLPTMISTAHLGLSMIYFVCLIYIYHKIISETDESASITTKLTVWSNNLKPAVLFVTILIYFQILLGALTRHLGLGGVCGVGFENSLFCFDMVNFTEGLIPASIQAKLHFLHRLMGVAVFFVVMWVSLFGLKLLKLNKLTQESFLAKLLTFWLFAVLSQFVLGISTVGTNFDEVVTTLHLGGAALILGIGWFLFLRLNVFEIKNDLSSSFNLFSDLFSLTKPRLSGLVIFTATLGLYLAPGEIDLSKALLAIISTALIVAGACTINCYMERDIDKLMKRTAMRPLPSGRIPAWSALLLGVLLLTVNIPLLYFYVNPLTAYLGLAATVFYVFLYTPLKRKSTFALFVGAVPGAIPPLMGWTAVTNSIDAFGLAIFSILFVWQLPHFLSISLFYAEDYKNAGIKIVPNISGIRPTKWRIVFYTFILAALGISPWLLNVRGQAYMFLSLLLGLIFLVYAFYGLTKEEGSFLDRVWAKNYFWGSLMYLPSVLALMVLMN
jgi:protoheme IX farnesyltransferase